MPEKVRSFLKHRKQKKKHTAWIMFTWGIVPSGGTFHSLAAVFSKPNGNLTVTN